MQTATDCLMGVGETRAPSLSAMVRGEVYGPGDCGYEQARRAWNLTVDQHPALIVVARAPWDVASAVRFAAGQGMRVAVQATGHGGVAAREDALLIITSELNGVAIDPSARTARVGAGATWAHVVDAAHLYGLAPLLGSSPHLGAVGYTLGGGVGWLARKHGLAADSVLSFTLVLVNGQTVTASATENTELFWALRGGGGGLGIVTAMEIRLYEVTTVYAGNLVFPGDLAHDALTRYGAWVDALPDELTSSIVLMNAPPAGDTPEPHGGGPLVMVRGCFAGTAADGSRLMDHWRSWRPPIADTFREMPFSEAATISNDPDHPTSATSTGLWLRDLSAETAGVLIRHTFPATAGAQGRLRTASASASRAAVLAGVPGSARATGHSPALDELGEPSGATGHRGRNAPRNASPRSVRPVFTEVRHLGGAIGRPQGHEAGGAFPHRDQTLLLNTVVPVPTRDARPAVDRHLRTLERDLGDHATGSLYLNFADGAARAHRTADALTPEVYQRLRHLKRVYDPDNVFRHGIDLT